MLEEGSSHSCPPILGRQKPKTAPQRSLQASCSTQENSQGEQQKHFLLLLLLRILLLLLYFLLLLQSVLLQLS